MSLKEYATLTELMRGREPGSVKVRLSRKDAADEDTFRVGRLNPDGSRPALDALGHPWTVSDQGPWFLVSEDAPATDTLRLEIAARIYCAALAHPQHSVTDYGEFRSSCFEQADALIAEARK